MICNNSDKVRLRPVEKKDLSLIQKWRNTDSIQPFLREYREMSLRHIENWYENMILDNKFEFFLVEDSKTNPIGISGFTYIDWINKNADLHLAIYEKPWGDIKIGNEIMKIMLNYGFNFLNFHRIYAEIYEIDKDKIELFNLFDFKKDAILRDHYYYKGKYTNSLIFSLLKNEYEK